MAQLFQISPEYSTLSTILNAIIFLDTPVALLCLYFDLGYVRAVLNLSAFYVMLHKPYLTVALHFAGGLLLDVVDGVTARHFSQC